MFKKALIVEDQEVATLGIITTLENLHIQNFDFVSYCDEALQKLKIAAKENKPYDLLIADLSFNKDHIPQRVNTGQELISEARKIQSDIKVIVFSVEKKAKIIDDLYKIFNINGFVSKARNDGKELRNTIRKVFDGETVIPQEILNAIRNIPFDLGKYEIKLLELLAKGYKQNEIRIHLKENHIQPYSIRSIEKNSMSFEKPLMQKIILR